MSMYRGDRLKLFTFIALLTFFGFLIINSDIGRARQVLKVKNNLLSDSKVTNVNQKIEKRFKKIISSMDYGTSDVGKILAARRKQLMQFCDGKELLKVGNSSEKEIKRNFLYDFNHKIIYCAIEKSGSTFWKSVFSIMSGNANVSDPYDVKNVHFKKFNTLEGIQFDKLYAIMQESMKMVSVRDPYARLFSSYLDKIFDINPYYWSYGIDAIKQFRKNPSTLSLKCGHDIKFGELVKYVIYTEHHAIHRDTHFTSLSDHCRPCQMKYDVIVKMETAKKDTLFVLRMLRSLDLEPFLAKLSKNDDYSEMKIIENTIKNAFDSMKSVSKCISRGELIRRTWRSIQMRGYIGKNRTYPLSKSEELTINEESLLKVFHAASKNSESREKRAKNRQLALEEAYSHVPMEDLIELQKLFETDCHAFGYDCQPEYIFDKSRKPKSNFLDIWQA